MDYSSSERGKDSNKTKGILIGFLVVFVVLGGIGGLFYYHMLQSKNRFEVLIENVFDYLEANVSKERVQSVTGTFSFQMNGQANDDANEVFNIINKIDLSGTYGVDFSNQIINLEIKSNYDKKELMNVDVYTENGNGYIYLDDLYDKYIKLPIDHYSELFQNNQYQDDYQVILKSVRKALIDSLKEEYFTQEKITLDSKKVDKITLDLSKENYGEIKKSLITVLLEDDAFLKSMAKVTDQDVDAVKESFHDLLEEEDEFEGMDLILYTKNSEFVRLDIADDTDKIVVAYNDDQYTYEYYENDQLLCNGDVKLEKVNEETKVTVSITDIKEKTSVKVVVQGSIHENDQVSKKDVTNSIAYEDISSDEMLDIYSKMMDNEGMVSILQEINKLGSKMSSDDVSLGDITS